ncbi:MAG: MFS transporter [Propionibacteriales bacterium]|nr:MFS transporter [Propionibacteriales bacterium]
MGETARVGLGPRALLVIAAIAVGFAAADTYVVVLALPDMMASVGLNIDQLQRAAPIVSGFLLGYIAMLPLIGRIADLRGRVPVLVGSLVVFSVGSLVTAAQYDLISMVIGRFLQGVGGGGLVPATLALVADIWAVDKRGLPLGIVGAVQELGSVVGPLYGALVLAYSSWHTIFWLNMVVGLGLAAALTTLARSSSARSSSARSSASTVGGCGAQPDLIGALLAVAAIVTMALVLIEPERLKTGLTTGLAFIPHVGESRWSTPLALTFIAVVVMFVARELTAHRPLVNLRGLREISAAADLLGAALIGLALAGIVLAFATADPEVQVLSPLGPWFLGSSAIAAGLLGWRLRTAATPLIPRGALASRSAWGSIVVSFFVGASLIAALVDIPIFARVTTYPDSQLGAALVLVRLLAALPVGALLGGYLIRHLPIGLLSGSGMLLAAGGFAWMAQWGRETLDHPSATIPLILCGLGFGLAIAPVNAALLASTRTAVHGIASALVVVARMVGMLVGISALTTIGLRRFYAVSAEQPDIDDVCRSQRICSDYVDILKDAGIAQIHAIFWGAAVCAVVAALLSVVLLRGTAVRAQEAGTPR